MNQTTDIIHEILGGGNGFPVHQGECAIPFFFFFSRFFFFLSLFFSCSLLLCFIVLEDWDFGTAGGRGKGGGGEEVLIRMGKQIGLKL